jgi:predicted amino acid-binding ACT domain protein
MASPYIVRKTAYFSMKTPNRPGQGARILSGLAAHGVNLVAFTGFPSGSRAQVDFMPYNPKKFVEAARKLGYKVSARKTVFLATGKDRVGAIASICSKLAAAGVNMVAMDAVASGAGRFGAIFWVKPGDVAKASRVLNVN